MKRCFVKEVDHKMEYHRPEDLHRPKLRHNYDNNDNKAIWVLVPIGFILLMIWVWQ